MDWLLPLKTGTHNPELRASLRSWVTHGGLTEADTLWVIGDCPRWLTGVRHLPGNRFRSKPENVYDNIMRACQHPDIPDWVVVVNDDFIITEPADVTEIAYRGTLDDHIAMLRNRRSWWIQSLEAARDHLTARGIARPLSYELHRPLLIHTGRMEQALREASWHQPDNPPQWRTIYGNRWNIGGTQHPDGKLYGHTTERPATPFLSTSPGVMRRSTLVPSIIGAFPEPCRYEGRP